MAGRRSRSGSPSPAGSGSGSSSDWGRHPRFSRSLSPSISDGAKCGACEWLGVRCRGTNCLYYRHFPPGDAGRTADFINLDSCYREDFIRKGLLSIPASSTERDLFIKSVLMGLEIRDRGGNVPTFITALEETVAKLKIKQMEAIDEFMSKRDERLEGRALVYILKLRALGLRRSYDVKCDQVDNLLRKA